MKAEPPPAHDAAPRPASWRRLAQRLYLLAVGSVVVAIVAAVIVARSAAPTWSPPMIRSTLWRLAQHLDDPAAREREVERLAEELGLRVALYDDDSRGAALLAASVDEPPPLPPQHDRHGGTIDGRRDEPPRDRPRHDGPHGLHDGPRGPRRPPPHGPPLPPPGLWPRRDVVIADRLISPRGETYWAVVVLEGDARRVLLIVAVVALLLLLVSVPFALFLTRPLQELMRATEAFGQGARGARVDVHRAGAFADLAATFNAMAARVDAARHAERELLQNVSHELRTPMARMRVALDIAAEADPKSVADLHVDLGADLRELEQLVADVLQNARLDATQGPLGAPLSLSPTPARALLDDVSDTFQRAWPDRTLVRDGDDSGLAVAADAPLLRRALNNLLDNAGKYSEPGGVVRLSAAGDGGHLVIDVIDEGCGISAADQARLFEPFFRADKSRARARGGVGLGLLLAQKIVVAHGGTLALTSELARGTRVCVRFPLTALDPPPP